MAARLRRLAGRDIVSILNRFGFDLVSQKGSHAKLRRLSPSGSRETITVPIHEELDVGTLHALFRQACKYVPEDELRPHFYSD